MTTRPPSAPFGLLIGWEIYSPEGVLRPSPLIRTFSSIFGIAFFESFQSQLYVILIVNNYMWLLGNNNKRLR